MKRTIIALTTVVALAGCTGLPQDRDSDVVATAMLGALIVPFLIP